MKEIIPSDSVILLLGIACYLLYKSDEDEEGIECRAIREYE